MGTKSVRDEQIVTGTKKDQTNLDSMNHPITLMLRDGTNGEVKYLSERVFELIKRINVRKVNNE